MDIYKYLKGEATIKEPYGYEKFISFAADRTGHIVVKGYLCDDARSNELRFEIIFDQTYLRGFAEELSSAYSKAIPHRKKIVRKSLQYGKIAV